MIFDPDTHQLSFACDDDDEEEIIDPKKHYAELVDDVKHMMARIHATKNDVFPDFLWEISKNEFTDDAYEDPNQYIEMGLGHMQVENGAEIIDSIKTLKNRYKDYFDYIDALDVWTRYFYFIEDTYGDFDFFTEMVNNGTTTVPLKRKPKLRNAKKNKYLLEIDVPISRINREDGLTDEQLHELCDEMPDQIEIYEDYHEYVTYLAKYNKTEEKRLQRENRIRNYRKTSSVGTPEGDAIMHYLTGESTYSEYGTSITNKPLTAELEAFHEFDGIEDDLKRDMMGLRRQVYLDPNYQILMETGQSKDDLEVYSALASAGYDVGIMMKNSSMDRKAVKMITRNIPGYAEEVSSKKAKKLKKKRAKNERKLFEQLSANEEVRSILTKNRVSFDPDDNMLSFTLSDIKKGL